MAVAADDALRQRAARAITGACGILVTIPLAWTSLVTAGALLSSSCRPAWWAPAGWALLTLLPVTVALMGWCAAVLLAPARSASPHAPDGRPPRLIVDTGDPDTTLRAARRQLAGLIRSAV